MRRALVALPLVLAALAAGCGTSSSTSTSAFKGEEKAVADQIAALQSAGERRDAKKICDQILARSLRAQIQAAGSSCQDEMDKAIKDADDFKLVIEDVTVSGGKATAKVRGRDKGTQTVHTFQFVREGSDWRATSFG